MFILYSIDINTEKGRVKEHVDTEQKTESYGMDTEIVDENNDVIINSSVAAHTLPHLPPYVPMNVYLFDPRYCFIYGSYNACSRYILMQVRYGPRIFSCFFLVNMCFQATGHNCSLRKVLFGLRGPFTIRKYTLLLSG